MAAVPRAPAILSKEAKAEWRRVAPLLVARHILTDADLGTLESYAIAIGTVREARRVIAAEGLTFMGASGPKRHPAVGVMNEAMGLALRLAAELGLTPVSRSRPSIRDDDRDDEGDALGLA